MELTLDLLADLAFKLNNKNPRERSRLVDALKDFSKERSFLTKSANSPNKLTSSRNNLASPSLLK